MSGGKHWVKRDFMTNEMRDEAVKVAREAIKENKLYMEMAEHIQDHFDSEYGPLWICCVGKDYGIAAGCPIRLGGREIQVAFSTSKRIVQRGGDKDPEQQQQQQQPDECLENKVLLYTIYNAHHPISIEVIHKITSAFGEVARIVMFRKTQVQAMVEFKTLDSARWAKRNLNGADVYAGCCHLKMDYARPTTLTVTRNDVDTWDFEVNSNTESPAMRQPIQTNSLLGSFQLFDQPNQCVQMNPGRCLVPAQQYELEAMLNTKPSDSLTPVVMVYNLDMNQMNCDRLFNLLCPYGNVVRVKFLQSNEGSAMVEMSDPYAVDRIIDNLSGFALMGNQLLIRSSRQHKIVDVQQSYILPDGTPSYKSYGQNRNNRYSTPTLASKNRSFRPSTALHFWNAPLDFTVEDIHNICTELRAPLPVTFKPYSKTTLRTSSGVVQWAKDTDALAALALVNHYEIPNPSGSMPFILKLAFASDPVRT